MPPVEIPIVGSGHAPKAAPARSIRRATARRASKRRATARNLHGDTTTMIIDTIAEHPGSAAGDVAKFLNVDRADVSTCLVQLAKTGEVTRASHGYTRLDCEDGE